MQDKAKDVYNDLKVKILSDQLKHGHHLTEVNLAKEYGVSRLHIKAALAELASDQLIEHRAERGYFVLGITPEAIHEINQLRKHLTAIILEEGIDAVSPDEIDSLKRILMKLRVFIENDMFDMAVEEVMAYYDVLMRNSSCIRTISILEKYNDCIFYIIRHSMDKKQDHEEGYRFLAELTACMETRDLAGCLRAVYTKACYSGTWHGKSNAD